MLGVSSTPAVTGRNRTMSTTCSGCGQRLHLCTCNHKPASALIKSPPFMPEWTAFDQKALDALNAKRVAAEEWRNEQVLKLARTALSMVSFHDPEDVERNARAILEST